MRAKLCCDALEMALGRRGPVPGLIHHSDRGSQYVGGDYRKRIKKAGLTQSMHHKRECLDNAPMESLCLTEREAGASPAFQTAGSGEGCNLRVH
jgi:transposase InsO family protein